jgi:hypothetical protein
MLVGSARQLAGKQSFAWSGFVLSTYSPASWRQRFAAVVGRSACMSSRSSLRSGNFFPTAHLPVPMADGTQRE